MGKWGSFGERDKTFRVELVDPETGEVIKNKDGVAAYIDVYAFDSVVGRNFDRDERMASLDAVRKGKKASSQIADPFEANVAKCAALTAAWHLVDPATGETIDEPCTIENAKELYSLPRTTWLFVQPWAAANNHANFIKRSADSSTSTQSGASDEAAS